MHSLTQPWYAALQPGCLLCCSAACFRTSAVLWYQSWYQLKALPLGLLRLHINVLLLMLMPLPLLLLDLVALEKLCDCMAAEVEAAPGDPVTLGNRHKFIECLCGHFFSMTEQVGCTPMPWAAPGFVIVAVSGSCLACLLLLAGCAVEPLAMSWHCLLALVPVTL